MKKFRPLLILLITICVISSLPAFSQVKCSLLQASNASAGTHASNMGWGLSGMGFYSIYKASKGA